MLQRRVRDVLVGSTLILVPAVAVNLWMTVVAFDRFDPDEALLPSLSDDTTATGVEDVSVWLAVSFVGVVTVIVGHLAAQILLSDRFSTPVPLRDALRETTRRIPSLVWLWLLTHWWVPVFSLAVLTSSVDDTSGLVTLYVGAAWFASAFTLLAVPAMVGEGLGAFSAARRAFRLARLRYGSCLGFVLLSTVLSGAFLFGLATLAPLLEATGFLPLGDAAWIVQGILVQLGVVLVVPLIAMATAQFYVEVRLDAEGLDLVIAADRAFGVPA